MTDWPHAPSHRLTEGNTFIVTAGTYRKQHFFLGKERLQMLQDNLLSLSAEYQWQLQAWAILSNHYHFVGQCEGDPASLSDLIRHLHSVTSAAINKADNIRGRKVLYQYWERNITFHASYLARLKYVHTNPVHHGLVSVAEAYPWCSAAWFERTASSPFYRTVMGAKTDTVNIHDDFAVEPGSW
jgi:putative transposase